MSKKKISPEHVAQELKNKELSVCPKKAQEILDFLYLLAELEVKNFRACILYGNFCSAISESLIQIEKKILLFAVKGSWDGLAQDSLYNFKKTESPYNPAATSNCFRFITLWSILSAAFRNIFK